MKGGRAFHRSLQPSRKAIAIQPRQLHDVPQPAADRRPASLGSFKLRVFVAEEVWYDSLQKAWIRNCASVGIIKQMSGRFTAEVFYLGRTTDARDLATRT